MIGNTVFYSIVYVWIAAALLTMPLLLKVTAPYGRHASNNWGPMIDNRLGWMVMEWVAPIIFIAFFLFGRNQHSLVNWLLFSLWMLHYINRSFIYPLRQKTRGKKIPLIAVITGVFFNFTNAFIVGHYLGSIRVPFSVSWLYDVRFITGFTMFFVGLSINWRSDNTLLNLRGPEESDYKIPRGALFEFVSCPNHFGEIVEWLGFSIICWSVPVFAFALWTAANLIPRSIDHHRWYKERFINYPKERKAIIPFIL